MAKVQIYGKIDNYHKEIERINKASISQKNKELIIRFLDHLLANNVGNLRAIKLGIGLRRIAIWFDKDFDSVTKDDDFELKLALAKAKQIQDKKQTYYVATPNNNMPLMVTILVGMVVLIGILGFYYQRNSK